MTNCICIPTIQRSDSLDYQDEKVQKSIAGFITAPYERPTAYPGLIGAGTATQRDALPHSSSASASPVGRLGADTVLSGLAGVTSHTPGQHTNGSDRSGNQLLNTKGVAQVWGRKPDPPVPASVNGSKVSPPNAPSPVMPTSTAAAYPAYASCDQKESKKEKEVEEVREPSEREKMALALFGGMKPIASSSSSSSMQKGGAVTAVSVSPTILIQPIPHKGSIKGSTGPDHSPAPVPAPIQTRTPDFMNLNPSPKHDSPFTSSSSPSSASSSSSKLINTNTGNHINGSGNGNGNANGVGTVISTSRSQSPNTPPLNPTMSSSAAVPVLVPVPVTSTPSLPVLTPLKVTTQYFGQLWSQVGPSDGPALLEWKSACQCGITTLERLRAVLPPHYGHIESIPATQEAIFASLVASPSSSSSSSSYPSSLDTMQLLSPNPALPHAGNGVQVNMVILIHIQLQVGHDTGAGKVEITVKSSSRDVCASTMQSLTSTLSSSY